MVSNVAIRLNAHLPTVVSSQPGPAPVGRMFFILSTSHFVGKIRSGMILWIGHQWHQISTHRVAQKKLPKKHTKTRPQFHWRFLYRIRSHLHIQILELSSIDYWIVALWAMELGTNAVNCGHKRTNLIEHSKKWHDGSSVRTGPLQLKAMDLWPNAVNCEHRHTDYIKHEKVCSRMDLRECLSITIHKTINFIGKSTQ